MNPFAQDFHRSLGDDKELASVFPFDQQFVPQRDLFRFEVATIREMIVSGSPENKGTLRSDSAGNDATFPDTSTSIRSAFVSSTFVRLTRYVPPSTCTHGNRLKSQRGVIDMIFGDVFVVFARFRATDVVTLR